jgi:hypothetical protein
MASLLLRSDSSLDAKDKFRMTTTTWKPHDKQGRLTKRSDLPDSVFAYPKERKEPMTNAAHVRNAVARFDQVDGVSDAERSRAIANIKKAAQHFSVEISEKRWTELGRKPSTGLSKSKRKQAAARGALTRKTNATKTTRKRARSSVST